MCEMMFTPSAYTSFMPTDAEGEYCAPAPSGQISVEGAGPSPRPPQNTRPP